MKYIEQRMDDLEKEINFLKAKIKLKETRTTGLVLKTDDYMYNPSVNLMSMPELETSFASSWDSSAMFECPSNPIMVSLSSISFDNIFTNPDYFDFLDNPAYYPEYPAYYPEYPNIIGSWDNESNSDCDIRTNKEDVITTLWKFTSEFDTSDKDFQEYLNTTPQNSLNMKTYAEQNIEQTFGKIISKIKILHHSWECDGYGYIVEKEGKRKLILTDHSKPYVANISDLNSKISEYKSIIQETERAIFNLK